MVHKQCTTYRARLVIVGTWVAVSIYSAPWLGLVGTRLLITADATEMVKCDFLISRNLYLTFFLCDVLLFYVVPLLVSIVLYSRICLVLCRSIREVKEEIDHSFELCAPLASIETSKSQVHSQNHSKML